MNPSANPKESSVYSDLANVTISDPDPDPDSAPASTPANQTKYQLSTRALHADNLNNLQNSQYPDIAPPLHLSSTFAYPSSAEQLLTLRERQSQQQTPAETQHVYSRETNPNTTRLELLLTSLLHGESIVYASGLAALHALYIHLRPKRVAITGGYHGAHAVLALHGRIMSGLEVTTLESAAAAGNSPLRAGDVIHLETPVNPTGEARSIAFYAALAHQTGAYLVVDSTFGPPGLQDPFEWGADVVMHFGTKYLGGHSDLLCGVLATRKGEWARALKEDRTVLGSVLGGMEAWLCMRGLRTLSVRVERASSNAGQLVGWLESERAREGSAISRTVTGVAHASLQPEAAVQGSWLRRQMPLGYGGVFAIVLREREMARRLPGCLKLFRHATSLGGVESLIEWRAMSDDAVEEGLVRVSVGIEDWRDLKADLQAGFEEVVRLSLLSGLT